MSWKHEEFAKEKQKELRKEIERAREEKLSLRDIPKTTFSLALANIAIFIFFSS